MPAKMVPDHVRFPVFPLGVLFVMLLLAGQAPALSIKVAMTTPASVISLDDGTMYRSDSGDFFPAYLKSQAEQYAAPWTRLYIIPNDAQAPRSLTVRFRVEGLPPETTAINFDSIWINEGTGWNDVEPGETSLGELGEGWYEFSYTTSSIYWRWFFEIDLMVDLYAGSGNDTAPRYSRVSLRCSETNAFELVDREGGPLDRWYRLIQYDWPAGYTDNMALPEDFVFERAEKPTPNELVEISGANVKYDPSSALTDSDGIFGVFAFVDPAAFEPTKDAKGVQIAEAKSSAMGSLRLKYKSLISDQNITGSFCEVIMVEGTVRVVEGSGVVKVGDILVPGQRLSLGASWGQKAQIGLRFVNGSDCSVIQDVFTNACLTDMIVIGSGGIEDVSVISGNSPLASVTRTLCEQVAGLPNTPGEWARATGKLVVKSAVSSVVPGSGITSFAIRYGVKKATGSAYDHVINAGGGGGKIALNGSSPQRLDVATYYDGSTRLTHNFDGSVVVIPSGGTSAITSVSAGEWQEILDGESLGREWSESPDSIDSTGPDLRFSAEYLGSGFTRFELKAFDPSGLDGGTFAASIGGSDATGSFSELGSGWWRTDVFGNLLGNTVQIGLRDVVGNISTLEWSNASAPGAPVIAGIEPGYFGGDGTVRWAPPVGMTDDDLAFCEVRAIGVNTENTWQSVGLLHGLSVPVPVAAWQGVPYYIELRVCDTDGRIGAIATSGPLHPINRPEGGDWWSIH